jgi:hypothetical protein
MPRQNALEQSIHTLQDEKQKGKTVRPKVGVGGVNREGEGG